MGLALVVINLESLLCPVRFRYLSMAASHCGLMYSVFHLVNVSVDQVESPLLKIRTLWSDARFRFLLSRYFSDEYKRGELERFAHNEIAGVKKKKKKRKLRLLEIVIIRTWLNSFSFETIGELIKILRL